MYLRKSLSAFTLIEILIASTIFVTLMGIVAGIAAHLSAVSNRTMAILEMHRDAKIITEGFFKNYENSHITTAIGLDFRDTNKISTTFMTNTHNEMDKNGSYTVTLYPSPTIADFVWNRLEFDMMTGTAFYGQTRNPVSGRTHYSRMRDSDLHASGTGSNKGISKYHIFATPQREYRFFEGTGNLKVANGNWVWDDDKDIAAGEKRQMYQHCDFETPSGGNSTDPRFTMDEKCYFFLQTHAVVGNNTLLSEDAYAVRNPDGITYNKDRLNLIGAPDKTTHADPYQTKELYPGQMHPLTTKNNIECGIIRYIRADGAAPTDDDTMNDLNDSLDIVGVNPQMQNATQIVDELENRPKYIECSFVLHNITNDIGDYEDIDGDPATIYLIDAIRNKIHVIDGGILDYASYLTEMQTRQDNFMALVKKSGFIALKFNFAKKLP